MWKFKIPFEKAHDQVYKSRWVFPNDGFRKQLKCFENMGYVFDTNSEVYIDFISENGNSSDSFLTIFIYFISLPRSTGLRSSILFHLQKVQVCY